MSIDNLLIQSLQLLGIGMGAVFIILSLLIALITIVSKLVPVETPKTASGLAPPASSPSGHIAAITGAVHQYRKNRK